MNQNFRQMDPKKLEIKKITSEREAAIKEKDIDKATENYSDNVILYDVVGPLEHRGIEALKNRLNEWFSTLSEINDFEITVKELIASMDLAYCSSLNHIDAINKDGNKLDMWWRETTCYTKVNGNWEITHAHSSVPFNPETGKASIDLKPASNV